LLLPSVDTSLCVGDTDHAEGMLVVGKIAFSPKEVLGRGSEGTFVYRSVFDVEMLCYAIY